jgi:hypothetical protein
MELGRRSRAVRVGAATGGCGVSGGIRRVTSTVRGRTVRDRRLGRRRRTHGLRYVDDYGEEDAGHDAGVWRS